MKIGINPLSILKLCNWRHEHFGIFAAFLAELRNESGYIEVDAENTNPNLPLYDPKDTRIKFKKKKRV